MSTSSSSHNSISSFQAFDDILIGQRSQYLFDCGT